MADGECLESKCLKRTKWCQRIPTNHKQDVCHNLSLKKRRILCEMKKLVNESYKFPVCDEWDTECTLNNTKGPYKFGRIDSSKQHQELIGSQLVARCDCGKKNGLQDDCRRWNCRGTPKCKALPFPKCGPFLGFPNDRTVPAYNPDSECVKRLFVGGDCMKCKCATKQN